MLRDSRTITDGRTVEADLCLIGAGMVGITLARELAGTGKRIVLLESGGLEPDKETQDLYRGPNVGRRYFDLDGARARFFGGSSNCWRGVCRPLDAIDFEKRDEIPGSGWPFGLQELIPFYERAQDYLDLGPFAYKSEAWQPLRHGTLRLDKTRIETGVMQLSEARFLKKYVDEVRAFENVITHLYANVTEIVLGDGGSRAARVDVATLSGERFAVKAEWFVLATGGIENPRVLLASNSVRSAGVGNENDLVGRYFMEHPHVVTPRGVLPTSSSASVEYYTWQQVGETWVKAYLAPTPAVLREEKLPNSVAQLISPREPRDHLARGLYEVARQMDRGAERDPILLDVFTISEQTPNPDSRVSLQRERDATGMPRAQLDWRLNRTDIEGFKRTHQIIARELGRASAGRMRMLLKDDADSWPTRMVGGFHHMGTTRMDADPKRGVVDANCRVHSVDNLFIGGSSVFPTAGAANPSLTIVALAIRLAEHLKGRLG